MLEEMSDLSNRCCNKMLEKLPREARLQLEKMRRGRLEGADVEVLYSRVPQQLRGQLFLCLGDLALAPDLLRRCVRHFWKVDNHLILTAADFSVERCRAIFRQANFAPPCDLAPILQVWRGATGMTFDQTREGLCWSRNRNAACWFATLWERRNPGSPIVVTAQITSRQILFYDLDDGLCESEVVLESSVSASIDPGTTSEWEECARRFISERRAAQTALD